MSFGSYVLAVIVMVTGLKEPSSNIPEYTSRLQPHEIAEADMHLKDVVEASCSIHRPVTIHARHYSGKSERLCVNEKVIHFIRHGEGSHNVHGAEWKARKRNGNAYTNEKCPIDAMLTEKGWVQARSIASALKAVCTERDQMVLTSPLRRAIQTASAAGEQLVGARYISHEALHEQGGLHRCDKRLDKSELATQFPHVDFGAILNESDPLWGDGNIREPHSRVILRAYDFLTGWLRNQEEQNIVLVTHSAYLLALFNGVLTCESHTLKSWFAVGELRSVVISFSDGINSTTVDNRTILRI